MTTYTIEAKARKGKYCLDENGFEFEHISEEVIQLVLTTVYDNERLVSLKGLETPLTEQILSDTFFQCSQGRTDEHAVLWFDEAQNAYDIHYTAKAVAICDGVLDEEFDFITFPDDKKIKLVVTYDEKHARACEESENFNVLAWEVKQ